MVEALWTARRAVAGRQNFICHAARVKIREPIKRIYAGGKPGRRLSGQATGDEVGIAASIVKQPELLRSV